MCILIDYEWHCPSLIQGLSAFLPKLFEWAQRIQSVYVRSKRKSWYFHQNPLLSRNMSQHPYPETPWLSCHKKTLHVPQSHHPHHVNSGLRKLCPIKEKMCKIKSFYASAHSWMKHLICNCRKDIFKWWSKQSWYQIYPAVNPEVSWATRLSWS